MQFRKCVLVVVTVLCSALVVMPSAEARKEPQVKKIVFVPHDGGQELVLPSCLKHFAEESLYLRGVVSIGLGAH